MALKTNIHDEQVAKRLEAPCWLPNTPPLTVWLNGEWTDSTGKRTHLKIWTVAVDPVPVRCLCVHCTHPHPHLAKPGKGTVFGDHGIVALVFVVQTTIITDVRLFKKVLSKGLGNKDEVPCLRLHAPQFIESCYNCNSSGMAKNFHNNIWGLLHKTLTGKTLLSMILPLTIGNKLRLK